MEEEEKIYQLEQDRICLIKMVKAAKLLLDGTKENMIWKAVYNVYSEDIEELEPIEPIGVYNE